jgi:O-6-methylguanine DNA methyltransferase
VTQLDQSVSTLLMTLSWGEVAVRARDGRIISCRLPHLASEPHKPFRLGKARITARSAEDGRLLKQAAGFVGAAFKGRAHAVPAFEWPECTPFTLRVLKALTAIPPGSTLQYGSLAAKIGRPGGARAVGRACGANPLPLFIPCHRVLPADGSLGGFSSGLPWKRLLLERENGSPNHPVARP